jgi:hypothetical protein
VAGDNARLVPAVGCVHERQITHHTSRPLWQAILDHPGGSTEQNLQHNQRRQYGAAAAFETVAIGLPVNQHGMNRDRQSQ